MILWIVNNIGRIPCLCKFENVAVSRELRTSNMAATSSILKPAVIDQQLMDQIGLHHCFVIHHRRKKKMEWGHGEIGRGDLCHFIRQQMRHQIQLTALPPPNGTRKSCTKMTSGNMEALFFFFHGNPCNVFTHPRLTEASAPCHSHLSGVMDWQELIMKPNSNRSFD